MRWFYYIICVLFILCGGSTAAAKSFVLYGRVVDSATHAPLVGATVVAEAGAGVITDIDGNFEIPIMETPSILAVDYMGYITETVKITALKQNIRVQLKADAIALDDIVVKGRRRLSRDEYAWYIHSQIVKNRERNNPDLIEPLRYSDYERASIFFLQTNKAARRDSTQSRYSYSPIMLNEKVTHNDRTDGTSSEQVVATQSSVLFESMTSHIDMVLRQKIAVDMNFYADQINLLGRGFPSPLSKNAQLYYRFYLIDSLEVAGAKEYHIRYYPRNKHSTTFIGDFAVDAASWAITEINADLPNTANLNFVSNFSVKLRYQKIAGSQRWFRDQQQTQMDLNLSGSGSGSSRYAVNEQDKRGGGLSDILHFRMRRSNSYTLLAGDQNLAQSAAVNNDATIHLERQKMPLDDNELVAKAYIDERKDKPWSKAIDKSANTVVSAHLNLGKIDIGPYYGLYRNTLVEGHRISVPLRTSEKMFKNFSVGGYLAYAFGVKEFGWNANTHLRMPTKQRFILSAEAYDDYFDLGHNRFFKFVQENPSNQGSGNFLSSITTYNPNPYMVRRSAVSLSAEYEISQNVSLLLRPAYERYNSNVMGKGYQPQIVFNQGTKGFSHFDSRNMLLDFRFSRDQSYTDNFFDRMYYGNEHPIFHATLIGGEYNMFENQRDAVQKGYYAHLNFIMKWRKSLGPMLFMSLLESGCIVGDVPYPLLDIPRGSGDMGSAMFHYNLLDHVSMASDRYAHAHLSLNMGGAILGKIPFIKALNMREVVCFKAYYGALQGCHNDVVEIPTFLREPSAVPYMEYSVGLSNIFQFLRVEYVRALSPGAVRVDGVKFRVEFNF